jgi:hypothetical protein
LVLAVGLSAKADDTKPPAIADVKAFAKAGKVSVEARITDETGVLSAICHHRTSGARYEDAPMVKDDYDDVFKTSFAGGPDTEYWIESSDLLGNGPATYGSQAKPYTVGGKAPAIVAKAEPAKEAPPKRSHKQQKTAKASKAPVIDHKKPSGQQPEDKDFIVRMRIQSDSPVAVGLLQVKSQGSVGFTNLKLNHVVGDNYDATIPASLAHGTVEYFIVAKSEAGQVSKQGDGDSATPFVAVFRNAAPAPAAKPAGPYLFTDNPPYRVTPGKPIVLRAQVVPASDTGALPDRVAVLWRANDAQDQMTDMQPDATGGYGGFRAEIPAQDEGGFWFQIVACDATASRCAIDTGSKRKWHAAAVASQAGARQPQPIDAVSKRAPGALTE